MPPISKLVTEEELRDLVSRDLPYSEIQIKLSIGKNHLRRLCKKYGFNRTRKQSSEIQKNSMLKNWGVEHPLRSPVIISKMRQNNLKKWGYEYVSQVPAIVAKIAQANKISHNRPEVKNKAKQTCLERYGVDSYSKTLEFKDQIDFAWHVSKKFLIKAKQTYIQHYGVDNYTKTLEYKNMMRGKLEEHLQKAYQTRKRNNTLNSYQSKKEDQVYELLLTKFLEEDIVRQYKSELYPFNCDFYIKSLDLYIEFQGNLYHYKEPYNKNNPEHQKKLIQLKKKYYDNPKSIYESQIKVWTERDPLKREVVKKNNLNFKEFFSLKEVRNWLKLVKETK